MELIFNPPREREFQLEMILDLPPLRTQIELLLNWTQEKDIVRDLSLRFPQMRSLLRHLTQVEALFSQFNEHLHKSFTDDETLRACDFGHILEFHDFLKQANSLFKQRLIHQLR